MTLQQQAQRKAAPTDAARLENDYPAGSSQALRKPHRQDGRSIEVNRLVEPIALVQRPLRLKHQLRPTTLQRRHLMPQRLLHLQMLRQRAARPAVAITTLDAKHSRISAAHARHLVPTQLQHHPMLLHQQTRLPHPPLPDAAC